MSLEELRNKPTDELIQKAQGFRRPIIDGYVMPDVIANIFAEGKENKVALLTGWNQNEGLLFGRYNFVAHLFEIARRFLQDAYDNLKFR